MLKNRILLALFALIFCNAIKAQIIINDARLLLPSGQTYGSGGTIGVPISVNGCVPSNNKFIWQLLDGVTNLPLTPLAGTKDSIAAFYATFVNVNLKASLPTGLYKVRISASTPGVIGDTSAAFTITNTAGSLVIASAIPTDPNKILRDQYYYGICDGLSVAGMALADSSTAGATTTLDLIDNYRNTAAVAYTPSGGVFSLVFNPTQIGSKFRDAYYTAFLKAVVGNIVSTKAYHIINSTWDIKADVLAKKPGTEYSCGGDTISLQIKTNQDEQVQQNFPASIVRVAWNAAGTISNTYTQCEILANNGVVKHYYANGACLAAGTTSYQITATTQNPFNVFNGPGITGTCAAGATSPTQAYVFSKPTASFRMDSVVCANDTLRFRNISNPGQGPAASGNLTICANLASYTWVIDGVVTPKPYYQTPANKVETPKDTLTIFNSTQFGNHLVTLRINNNYLSQAPCPAHDTTLRVCVDTAKVRPEFKLDSASAGVIRDSIVGCAPGFKVQNNTKRTFCVDTSQFKWVWRMLDATTPYPYTEILEGGAGGGKWRFGTGSTKNSKEPSISINRTGKYFLELNASASCSVDTSFRMLKYIEANGDAGVSFPTGLNTVTSCIALTPLVINYNPNAGPNNQLFGSPTDSVSYSFQASAAGTLAYKWLITPGTYGNEYDTLPGTTTTSKYPQFRFNKPGYYKVKVLFTNSCQPKSDSQYVAYRQPVSNVSKPVGTDTICYNSTYIVKGFSIDTVTGGKIGRILWTSKLAGSFSPNNLPPSAPNILTPTFTPAAGSSNVTDSIVMSIFGEAPTTCASTSNFKYLFIRPEVTILNSEANSCSNTRINHFVTKAGLVGARITWTSTTTGVINGNTNNATGATAITDSLIGNGYVVYTIKATVINATDTCFGSPYTFTDTVRPIPLSPTITVLQPNNATQSMCSADSATFGVSGSFATDVFSWTARSSTGRIDTLTSGTNQPSPIGKRLYNNRVLPLLPDSAIYSFKTTSIFGCTGPADSNYIIVTPGPNVAQVAAPGKVLKVCGLSCDSLRANAPGTAGTGKWTVLTVPTGAAQPTIADDGKEVTSICGLVEGTYTIEWRIKLLLVGCNETADILTVFVTGTLPTVTLGNDTVYCKADGNTPNIMNFKGKVSRALLSIESYGWRVISEPTNSYAYFATPTASTSDFNFTKLGTYKIGFFVANGVCTNSEDTLVLKVFGRPKSGSLSISPSLSSYCRGTPMTLTGNIDTNFGVIKSWIFYKSPFDGTSNIEQGGNPYARPGSLVQREEGVYGIVYSKGFDDGCKDSVQTNGFLIYIDPKSKAGKIVSADSVVCTPNSTVTLNLTGNVGTGVSWIVSTTDSATGYNSPGASGNPIGSTGNATVAVTSWFKAIVKSGNCSSDTTPAFRVYIPSGADVAKAGNDTMLCGASSFLLQGNVPVVGNGLWRIIRGVVNAPQAGTFTFGASPNDTTSTNPVLVNIQAYGTYQFVWAVRNLNCLATADTITIVNTAPIVSTPIATTQDTVCNGTRVNVTGGLATGGGASSTYNWQYSTNSGASWTLGSNAIYGYGFTATQDIWVRRVIKSDSCTDISNIIKFVVQPKIANNTVTAAFQAVCINSAAPLMNGSVPTGGDNTYSYTWYYATNQDTANRIWNNAGVNTEDYTYPINLTDTLHFIRRVVSGKCLDTSVISTVTVLPDAKANFLSIAPPSTNNTRCAAYSIGNDIINNVLPNTQYNWYLDTTGASGTALINTGNQFAGHIIRNGLDSALVTLIAISTNNPVCKSDTQRVMFRTSATPNASFTISADSGCAANTTNATNFSFTNTTKDKTLFPNVVWNLNSTTLTNYGQIDFPAGASFQYDPSTSGLDKIYYVSLTVNSAGCGTSVVSKPLKIRTKPRVLFTSDYTYRCSGLPILFTNATTGNNLTYNWYFGDNYSTIGSTNRDTVSHTFVTNAQTSLPIKLEANNECAKDSFVQYVTIEANKVVLNFNIKGTNIRQCSPSTVKFYNNSVGASNYVYDFGDATTSNPNPNGKDSIEHTYTKAGTYIVKLTGSTQCGNTDKYDTVFVYATPKASFTISPNSTVCKGDTVRFINTTDSATTYTWNFASSVKNPSTVFNISGANTVNVIATRTHNLTSGGPLYCSDTSATQIVTVRDTMKAAITYTSGSSCLPRLVQFTDNTVISTQPISSTTWIYGDGTPDGTTNGSSSHSYTVLGTYIATLIVKNAGGCVYKGDTTVNVYGPTGYYTQDTGYKCGADSVRFAFYGNNYTDSVEIDLQDGSGKLVVLPYATNRTFAFSYPSGGSYTPQVKLKSINGCIFPMPVVGTIRVDYVKAAYTVSKVPICGSTTVIYNASPSTADQNAAALTYTWTINGLSYTGKTQTINYTATTSFDVKLLVNSVSGCSDATIFNSIDVKVNNIPTILNVDRRDSACVNDGINYKINVAASEDAIKQYVWYFGNGNNPTTTSINNQTIYGSVGGYIDSVRVITDSGCSATIILPIIRIFGKPTVGINPTINPAICEGDTKLLTANGANSYTWQVIPSSAASISPNNTAAAITITPNSIGKYLVTGYKTYGSLTCSDTSSVTIDVVPKFTLSIAPAGINNICVGDSIMLSAIGAPAGSTYRWEPTNGGYFTTKQDSISVIAKPLASVTYQVFVTAPSGCFGTPTESKVIGVGDTLKVSLGPVETITLQGGTKYTFTPSYNTPVATWNWSSSTDGNFNSTVANPQITVNSSSCYFVEATSAFGCKAYDSICIIAFCEASQVFIPNAFTPDGDAYNARFYVSGNGITVKSLRVFNRWGQVVFERSNYVPDPYMSKTPNTFTSWDGKFKGVIAPTEVYVYTCEVTCANGTKFTYTGNVSLIK